MPRVTDIRPGERLALFADELVRSLRVVHGRAPLPKEVVEAAARVTQALRETREDGEGSAPGAQDLIARQGARIGELEAAARREAAARLRARDGERIVGDVRAVLEVLARKPKDYVPKPWAEVDPLRQGNPDTCATCKGSGVTYPTAGN